MQCRLFTGWALALPPLGLQAAGAEVPPTFLPLSLGRLADALADVASHFKLKEVLGLGAGVGAQVLAQLAAEQPGVSARKVAGWGSRHQQACVASWSGCNAAVLPIESGMQQTSRVCRNPAACLLAHSMCM